MGSNIDCYNHIKIIVYFKDKLSTKVQHNTDSTKKSTAHITTIILLFSVQRHATVTQLTLAGTNRSQSMQHQLPSRFLFKTITQNFNWGSQLKCQISNIAFVNIAFVFYRRTFFRFRFLYVSRLKLCNIGLCYFYPGKYFLRENESIIHQLKKCAVSLSSGISERAQNLLGFILEYQKYECNTCFTAITEILSVQKKHPCRTAQHLNRMHQRAGLQQCLAKLEVMP